jgi:hypothetical protein
MDKRQPYIRLLPWIQIRRGISPAQAKNPRSYAGKERMRRTDEATAKETSIRWQGNLETIRVK